MDYFEARVLESRDLEDGYTWVKLGDCGALTQSRPGQFVMLRGNWGRDPILPRPFSILAVDQEAVEILIRRVGVGSGLLADEAVGQPLQVLGPLGNSFPDPPAQGLDLLVAGGCGVAPLFFAGLRALSLGTDRRAELLWGAASQSELVLLERIHQEKIPLLTCTEDGSLGQQGLVSDLLKERLDGLLAEGKPDAGPVRILTCGPEGLMREVREIARDKQLPCLMSLEAPMACGVGACLGCAVEGKHKPFVYVCQEGPVFDAEEVWP